MAYSGTGPAVTVACGRSAAGAGVAGFTGAKNIGDGVLLVCWAWTASLLTRDPLSIATAPLMVRMGWLSFAVFASVISDRHNRKRLILIADRFPVLLLALFAGIIFTTTPLTR